MTLKGSKRARPPTPPTPPIALSSPTKRSRHVAFSPPPPSLPSPYSSSPARPSSSIADSSFTSFYSAFSSAPSDSPTNPLGLARARDLHLPRATSFSKHVPLRFQVVGFDAPSSRGRQRSSAKARGKQPEQPFRIVQVPLNYSFRHLHAALVFLFADAIAPSTDAEAPPSPAPSTSSAELSPSPPPNPLPPTPEVPPEHIFEVMHDAKLYAMAYKPGVIRRARAVVKLTDTSEVWHAAGEDEAEAASDSEGESDGNTPAPAKERWKWENETDFHLSRVWDKGLDLSRVIIYVCGNSPYIIFN